MHFLFCHIISASTAGRKASEREGWIKRNNFIEFEFYSGRQSSCLFARIRIATHRCLLCTVSAPSCSRCLLSLPSHLLILLPFLVPRWCNACFVFCLHEFGVLAAPTCCTVLTRFGPVRRPLRRASLCKRANASCFCQWWLINVGVHGYWKLHLLPVVLRERWISSGGSSTSPVGVRHLPLCRDSGDPVDTFWPKKGVWNGASEMPWQGLFTVTEERRRTNGHSNAKKISVACHPPSLCTNSSTLCQFHCFFSCCLCPHHTTA